MPRPGGGPVLTRTGCRLQAGPSAASSEACPWLHQATAPGMWNARAGQAGPPELTVCISPSSASETSRRELGIRQGGNIHAMEIGKWFKVGLSSPQPLELVVNHFPAQNWSAHSCASRLGGTRAWVCVSHACMLPSFALTTTPSYRHCLHFTDGENRCRVFRELPRVTH